MISLRNRVQLIGRVGKDPEVINLEDGKKLAKFSMATNEYYFNANGDKIAVTNWHNVSFWNNSAKIIEKFVRKGNEIAVEGKLNNRSWEDDNGVRHIFTEVIGYNLVLMGKKNEVTVEE